MKTALRPLLLLAGLLASGCTSVSSNYMGEITRPTEEQLIACHGFNCYMKATIKLSAAENDRYAAIMALGAASAEAERAAAAEAISLFEKKTTEAIGVPDGAKSYGTQSGQRGQMDCIDESTNSRTMLLYLERRGLLKHHKVQPNVSRGFFADGRYPHSTAVLKDETGQKWAVDSWFEPAGGKPDIMPLPAWMRRGVMGQR